MPALPLRHAHPAANLGKLLSTSTSARFVTRHGVVIPEPAPTASSSPGGPRPPPPPGHIIPLCCHRSELPDRHMEWAPTHNSFPAFGSRNGSAHAVRGAYHQTTRSCKVCRPSPTAQNMAPKTKWGHQRPRHWRSSPSLGGKVVRAVLFHSVANSMPALSVRFVHPFRS